MASNQSKASSRAASTTSTTILSREIHLTAYDIAQSKYDGDMLTLQYEIYEPLTDEQGTVVDDDGQPVYGWVKHITFTGSKARGGQDYQTTHRDRRQAVLLHHCRPRPMTTTNEHVEL